MEHINLDLLPADGNRMLEEASAGNLVIARAKNDFLYVLEFDETLHMFSHTVGAPGGGQKQFPKDEKSTAIVRKIADLADAVYKAEFDKHMNLYSVMATAEQAVLEMFPGDDRSSDGIVDFSVPESE
ncbi:MAG: hypothetical protein FWD05_10510 [Oscillospiraceae bacterium]|nr:hypothetical protein [Oscillospiraceae bacterium]